MQLNHDNRKIKTGQVKKILDLTAFIRSFTELIFWCLRFLGGFRRKYIGKSYPRLLIIVVWGCYELFPVILKQEQAADRLGYLGTTTLDYPSIKILGEAHFDNYLMSDYIGLINYASK